MSAITELLIPDVISTSQTWAVSDESEYIKLVTRILGKLYPEHTWQQYAYREDEWSGAGTYRFQIRLNRPEGRPLYSLKWEGPL